MYIGLVHECEIVFNEKWVSTLNFRHASSSRIFLFPFIELFKEWYFEIKENNTNITSYLSEIQLV